MIEREREREREKKLVLITLSSVLLLISETLAANDELTALYQ